MTLAVRTASDPLAVAASVRKQIQTIDRDQPVPQFQTMREVLDASVAQKIS